MTHNDRKLLAETLAETLAQYTNPELRGVVLAAKDSIADMIHDKQGFEQWSQFNAQWRIEMNKPI